MLADCAQRRPTLPIEKVSGGALRHIKIMVKLPHPIRCELEIKGIRQAQLAFHKGIFNIGIRGKLKLVAPQTLIQALQLKRGASFPIRKITD